MSYRNYSSGCGPKLVFGLIIICIFLFIVNGIDECSSNTNRKTTTTGSISPYQKPEKVKMDGHLIDPVYRDSKGNVVTDTNNPDYYFDKRTTCKTCKGTGRRKRWDGEKVIEEWCSACKATGYGKRPISEMPEGKVPFEKID